MAGPNDSRVDRLIVVLFWRRDVVLEAAGHGAPGGVRDAEHAIAIVDAIDDDAECVDVGQLLEADLLVRHLAPDRVGLFLAALDLGLDADLIELLAQRGRNLLEEIAVALTQFGEFLVHGLIGVRVEPAERQLLQLFAQRLHAHATCERRVNLERFLRVALSALGLHVLESAHVVEAICELYEKHADIARNGEQKLPEVLGLLGLFRDEIEALDLGEAVDERADLRAEQLIDLGAGGVGVFDDVVEECGCDGRVVETEIGQDGGDFEGVGEIGISRGALLIAVRSHCVDVGPVQQGFVRRRVVLLNALDELVLAHHEPDRLPATRGSRRRAP